MAYGICRHKRDIHTRSKNLIKRRQGFPVERHRHRQSAVFVNGLNYCQYQPIIPQQQSGPAGENEKDQRENSGRNERIRTSDPFVPNEVRYQAAPHSEIWIAVRF